MLYYAGGSGEGYGAMVKRNYKVIWKDEAKASLRRIYNYIENKESVEQAINARNEIRDLAKSLGFMPHKYIEDLFLKDESGDIRFKAFWSSKIIGIFIFTEFYSASRTLFPLAFSY